jgi:hypothetical protein
MPPGPLARLAPQVFAVEFDQIKSNTHGILCGP